MDLYPNYGNKDPFFLKKTKPYKYSKILEGLVNQ